MPCGHRAARVFRCPEWPLPGAREALAPTWLLRFVLAARSNPPSPPRPARLNRERCSPPQLRRPPFPTVSETTVLCSFSNPSFLMHDFHCRLLTRTSMHCAPRDSNRPPRGASHGAPTGRQPRQTESSLGTHHSGGKYSCGLPIGESLFRRPLPANLSSSAASRHCTGFRSNPSSTSTGGLRWCVA